MYHYLIVSWVSYGGWIAIDRVWKTWLKKNKKKFRQKIVVSCIDLQTVVGGKHKIVLVILALGYFRMTGKTFVRIYFLYMYIYILYFFFFLLKNKSTPIRWPKKHMRVVSHCMRVYVGTKLPHEQRTKRI